MIKGKDYIGVGVGAMIFNDEGKVFLAKRGAKARNERGVWEFPGGGVKFGEGCEEALRREIKEELDIEIEVLELLELADHIIEAEGEHWVAPSYVTRLLSGEPKIMEPEKCDEIKWVNLEEIEVDKISIASQSNFRKYVEKFGFVPPKA